jgi:hypothetical protein
MTEEEIEPESASTTPKSRRISADGPTSLTDAPLEMFVAPAQVGDFRFLLSCPFE